MKITLLLLTPLASAFTSPPKQRTSMALCASRENVIAGTTAAALLGLGLAAQIAVAAPLEQQAPASITSSSTVMSATTVDQFSLPSYESSKGLSVIDLTDEVQDVNKKTMAAAKAKREYEDNSIEKTEMDKLRAIEAEESKLFESMTKQSDVDKRARVESEIAESRANRWKTF